MVRKIFFLSILAVAFAQGSEFECEHCERSYRSKAALESHSGTCPLSSDGSSASGNRRPPLLYKKPRVVAPLAQLKAAYEKLKKQGRPWECEFCNDFTESDDDTSENQSPSNSSMWTHMRSQHDEAKVMHCTECDFSTMGSVSLERHQVRHRSKDLPT